MEKAYDRIEWNHVFMTLEKLGFHPIWIKWIEECVSLESFSILINGISGDRFVPSRGLRQGDPLSPYLFILCAELLARQLHVYCFNNAKKLGVKIGRYGIKVPFVTFDDDTMIFRKANTESCNIIKIF